MVARLIAALAAARLCASLGGAVSVQLARGGEVPPDPSQALAAAAQAAAAAKRAWAAEAEVKAAAEANMKYIPLAKGQVDFAKAAAQTAVEEDAEATKYLEETRAAADAAALQAAMGYMARVKATVQSERAKGIVDTGAAETRAEVKVAQSVTAAAAPYHANLLRAQKVLVDDLKRAQELAAASNTLRSESVKLAGSAEDYQAVGQPIEANQIMMNAHSLMHRADMMKEKALQLQKSAQEIRDALPLWQQAEQAAVANAAEGANPRAFPDTAVPLY